MLVAFKLFPAPDETQNNNDDGDDEQDVDKPIHCV
jgi:hypothetical protein